MSYPQQVGLPYQVSCSCATRAKLRLPGTATNSYLALAALKTELVPKNDSLVFQKERCVFVLFSFLGRNGVFLSFCWGGWDDADDDDDDDDDG